jgi:Ras-related C3 botulinum toxin substrate 1
VVFVFFTAATKTDLRPAESNHPDAVGSADFVSTREGRKMKARINAARYVECSAKTREGLEDVFQEAIRSIGNGKRSPKARSCCVL